MAIQERDLNWYLENDQEPTDVEAAEMALNGYVEYDDGQPVTAEEEAEETPPASVPDDKEPPAKPETPPVEKTEEPEGTGVLAADGETVIPYKVLRGARDQVNELQTTNAELQQQLEEMQAKLAATPGDAVPTVVPDDVKQDLVEVEFERIHGKSLEEFKEEYGEEQANLFLAPVRENLAFKKELSEIRQSLSARAAQEETAVKITVQDAIDANPVLVDWQQNDPVMWKAAVAVDEALQSDPEWSVESGKSYEERFAEVTRRLGHEPKPASPAQKTPGEIAAEKLAAAGKKVVVPSSLSDVPGGTPAAETLRDQAEGMSEAELTQAMIDNPKLQAELLASLS